MDIYQMKYVSALAKHRNFTLAAESCFISQSSLSQQISKLEKELGVKLFDRTTRTIRITEAGQTFVDMSESILRDVDRLEQTMSTYAGFLRGTINIGAITALEKIGFSELVSEFYACYPNLTLNIYQGKSLSLLESLEKRNIDIAFVTQPWEHTNPQIDFRPIGKDEYSLIISDKHPLAQREVVDLIELKDEDFILQHPDQSVSGLCMQACAEAGFTPRVISRIESVSIAMNLARQGLGIVFLPSEVPEQYSMNGLRRLHLKKPIEKRIVMATRAKETPSHLVSAFIEFAQKHQTRPQNTIDNGQLTVDNCGIFLTEND